MKNKNKRHRYTIYEKYSYKCNYCYLQFPIPKDWDKKTALVHDNCFLELDHIIPVSKGGTDTLDNKQTLCSRCNKIKSNK